MKTETALRQMRDEYRADHNTVAAANVEGALRLLGDEANPSALTRLSDLIAGPALEALEKLSGAVNANLGKPTDCYLAVTNNRLRDTVNAVLAKARAEQAA